MRKTARISKCIRRLAGDAACLLLTAALLGACAGNEGDALEKACRTDEDCPDPARQTCIRTWGICAGQTNDLGTIDATVD